jgi:dihydroxyacid dehydratase/phosphogluconate dehydratase
MSASADRGGIAVLRGNLAPAGAIIKPAAASPHLIQHHGRALVFHSIEDFHARIDDPGLDVDANTVLVLRGCGPKGSRGMPSLEHVTAEEAARAGGPRHGTNLRRPDERHSYGTVVLHVAPEAAAGGPLALVQTDRRA